LPVLLISALFLLIGYFYTIYCIETNSRAAFNFYRWHDENLQQDPPPTPILFYLWSIIPIFNIVLIYIFSKKALSYYVDKGVIESRVEINVRELSTRFWYLFVSFNVLAFVAARMLVYSMNHDLTIIVPEFFNLCSLILCVVWALTMLRYCEMLDNVKDQAHQHFASEE